MNNDEDLLQFKDYTYPESGDGGASSPPPAQINVNSPTHSSTIHGGRIRGDPLAELIYDMNNDAPSGSGFMQGAGNDGGGDGGGNLDGNPATPKGTQFLSLEYYQQFFNVDTYMVLDRIANSMIPKRAGGNYLKSTIGLNPDMYGPFWITVTLIFSIAISGNIANYLQYANDSYHWHYNFHLVSYAATCIFIYACCVPAVVWGLFKYSLKPVEEGLETESANYTPTLLSLMCIYGYSLFIYIPVSILWLIQISLLQWLLVITAAFMSGSVLIIVLTPALRNSKYSLFLIIGILSAHFLLAAGFMLYFFHVPSSSSTPAANNVTVATLLKAVKEVTTVASPVVGSIAP